MNARQRRAAVRRNRHLLGKRVQVWYMPDERCTVTKVDGRGSLMAGREGLRVWVNRPERAGMWVRVIDCQVMP